VSAARTVEVALARGENRSGRNAGRAGGMGMSVRLKFALCAVAIGGLLWWNPIYGMPRWLGWPLFVGAVYLLGEGAEAFVKAIRRGQTLADRTHE
jgi:hypothetical protein